MSDRTTDLDRLFDLVGTICDEDASQDELAELDSLAVADRAARDWYLSYCRLHGTLRVELRAHRATQAVCEQIGIRRIAIESRECEAARTALPDPAARFFPASLWHGTAACFSSGWPVAYLVATVIFGIGLVIGGIVHVSQPGQHVDLGRSVATPNPQSPIANPSSIVARISGRARHVWFLVAGSTHPMQSQLDNGEIVVAYADGTSERLPLHNPTTWWPIEGDYHLTIDSFCVPGPHPPRVDLGTGRGTLLDLPLNPERELKSVTVRCLANDVVVGLMSATLLRPK